MKVMNGGANQLPVFIKDAFAEVNTKHFLFHSGLTPTAKKLLVHVVNKEKSSNEFLASKTFETYEDISELFGNPSVECILSYLHYFLPRSDLMQRTIYVLGRVMPLKNTTDWLDNFRLQGFGNMFNMIKWNDYDPESENEFVYTSSMKYPNDINYSVTFSDSLTERITKFLVGSFRVEYLHSSKEVNPNTSKLTLNEGVTKDGVTSNVETTTRTSNAEVSTNHSGILNEGEEVTTNTSKLTLTEGILNEGTTTRTSNVWKDIDLCYQHFPFYWGGCHGCDVFDFEDMSLSIEEIKQFLERYPSAIVGYILNTCGYQDGSGEHWVSVSFMMDSKPKCKLVCSGGGSFKNFKQQGWIREMEKLGFDLEYSTIINQLDKHACGIYSTLATLFMIDYRNINKVTDAIGVDMKNINKNGVLSVIRNILGS